MKRDQVTLPPATIGILGGGQLGRMTALAARRMGYRIATYDPSGDKCPAASVSDQVIGAGWEDASAIRTFCDGTDVATLEFENIPLSTAQVVAEFVSLRPAYNVLEVCQHRGRERTFLAQNGFPQPKFELVSTALELTDAISRLGTPCVLKTAAFGYDGKGQRVIRSADNIESAWSEWGGTRGIIEEFVDFSCELSVICARGHDGRILAFPPIENVHTGGILDVSILPGRLDPGIAADAIELASAITDSLGVVGLLAVEMFLTSDARLLVNELAPRPHNSGHASFDACLTGQFEQHARAVCGLPLGDPSPLRPCVMVNLLGNIWRGDNLDQPPDWSVVLQEPRAKLHLYDKSPALPGRKMGHFCVLADTIEQALARAMHIREQLGCAPVQW